MSRNKCCSLHNVAFILVSLALASPIPLKSQPPPAALTASKPPADHPVLHDAFFRFADKLEGLHAQRKAQASGTQLQQVDRDFAGVIRISPSELERMFQVIRSASVEIKAIEEEMRKHANDRARWELPADHNTIRTLQERRQNAIQTNMNRLRTALTASGWTAVSGFINTDLRNATTIAQPAGAKP